MENKHYLNNLSFVVFMNLDNGRSFGSGFILTHESKRYLITAKHVLFDDEKLKFSDLTATLQNSRGTQSEAEIFEVDLTKSTILDSKTEDIAVIILESNAQHDLSTIITSVQKGTHEIITVSETDTRGIENISIPNDVYLIGFPTSLLFDNIRGFDITRPLLRKGIISGVNIGGNTFTIDCSAYYGNSGSPIVELGEDQVLRIIGLVSRYIPFVTQWKNNREPSVTHAEYINSGYSVCVAIDAVFDLINHHQNPKH